MKNLECLKRDWFGRLDDLTEELEEMGYEVAEVCSEYILVQHEDEEEEVTVETMLRLGGTEHTITVDEIKETARIR